MGRRVRVADPVSGLVIGSIANRVYWALKFVFVACGALLFAVMIWLIV